MIELGQIWEHWATRDRVLVTEVWSYADGRQRFNARKASFTSPHHPTPEAVWPWDTSEFLMTHWLVCNLSPPPAA